MQRNQDWDSAMRNREKERVDDEARRALEGDMAAGEQALKKKADEAKQMRDFLAYKQYQKELDKDRNKMSQEEYNKMIADNNRKQAEKERQWRLYYERFAQQQDGKHLDHAHQVLGPNAAKNMKEQNKMMQDINDVQMKERERTLDDLGRKA